MQNSMRDMVDSIAHYYIKGYNPATDTYEHLDMKTSSALDRQEGGSHYKSYAIQPIEYAMANNFNYCQANAVKYITRYRDKNGKEDLLKAIHNLEILIELEYGNDKEKESGS